MSLVNASDISHSLIPETTYGVTPTATATRYALPCSADQAPLKAEATTIASPTRMPNRSSKGSRRGMTTVDGSLDIRFTNAPVIDKLFESALSGTFTADELKAGQTDSSFSILHKLSPTMVKQFGGCMVSGFSLSVKGNDEVTTSWDIIGSVATNLSADNALPLTAVPDDAVEFISSEVASISVAGQTLAIAELTFDYKLDRTRRPVLGSDVGLALAVNGTKEITVTVRAYRESFDIDTAVTGLAQPVVFNIAADGEGYSFQMPAAFGSIPTDEVSDGSAFVTVTFTAGYDNTAGTDLVITKLTAA